MPGSEYHDARLGSINAVLDLFGRESLQYETVIAAWDAVGVYYPFVGPYAKYAFVNDTYQVPVTDTLAINALVVNPDLQSISVEAVINSFDLTLSDTLSLYDDGAHNDSSAGDGLWGNSWPIPPGLGDYRIHISTF